MNLSELTENSGKQLVIIYPGRFHPFHIGHGKVYKYLKQKYSNAKVFISTSGKVDGDRSPFTFDEKKKMMMLAGVDGSAIVRTKSPYQSVEIMERFDQNTTVMVFAVSEKDMAEDPRFDFSGGIKLKKNGEPAYLQKWNGLEDAETFGTRGYIATTPTFPFEVLGQKINSASQIRNMIVNSDDTKLTQMLQDLYNITDVPQDVIELFKTKIGNKDAMNENWDEDSFSKFLTENVIEENTMKRNILQAISEGKSPHKKGTKKYNAHMAAMHAESIDEEFDKKVEEVMELKKTNEWVQDSPAQGFSGQERNFIQELCLRMDGVSKSPEGLKWMGKSKTWDEGNVLSDKGKLTTVMLWAKKNIGDLYDKMGSEFKVYSDGNDIIGRSGRGQSDGNQIMQNIIKKIGKIGEPMKTNEEQLDEILPALGVAAAAGAVGTAAYKGGKALHKWMSNKNSKMPGSGMAKDAETALSNRKTQMNKNLGTLKNESESKERPYIVFHATKGSYQTHATSSYGAAKNAAKYWKLKSTAGITPKLADVEHVAENAYHNEQHEMLEYIHHVLQECGDGNMDITMVEQALEYVEEIREQHFDDEGNTKSEGVNEAGGYYTQPVYDMIKQHGYPKVMHRLLSALDADVIQDFISRESDLNEAVNKADILGDNYANVYYDYSESFYMIDVYKDGKKVEEYDDYIGAMEEGNPIKDKFLELVKKAGLEPEGLNLISTGGEEPDEYGVFKNGKFNWDKNVNENWKDVTPAGYGPDDYDEKDVAPEDHGGDLKKMQDTYKHNEDRNNHSENILMLAQAFGDRGEIKAVEGLLKIIKRQGHTTPEQSEMMYKAIHKKYYKQLFPETETEGNKFSGELEKAKIDGKKSFDVDGKTYKVKEALSKLIDKQKI